MLRRGEGHSPLTDRPGRLESNGQWRGLTLGWLGSARLASFRLVVAPLSRASSIIPWPGVVSYDDVSGVALSLVSNLIIINIWKL